MFWSENRPEWIIALWGCLLNGSILVPIDYRTSREFLDNISQIVEARLRVVEFYDASPSFVAALFARYDPIADSGYFLALRGDGSVIIRKRLQGKSASDRKSVV